MLDVNFLTNFLCCLIQEKIGPMAICVQSVNKTYGTHLRLVVGNLVLLFTILLAILQNKVLHRANTQGGASHLYCCPIAPLHR